MGWNWAVEVARLGHEVVALTEIEHREAIEAEQASGRLPATLRFEFFMPLWLDRMRDIGRRLGFSSLNDHLVHLIWQCLAARHVQRRFENEPFDLVHHVTYGGIRHPTFMGRLPSPLVLGPVGGGERAPYALRGGLPWSAWLKDLVRDLHTWCLRFDPITRRACADALVVYIKTDQSRRALPQQFDDKIAVQLEVGIRAGRQPRPPERPADQPLRLLFAARFLYWKGMHLGLKAFAEFVHRGGDARLTMLGRGPSERFWRQLADDLGIAHAIDWHDWVALAELGRFYRSHDALLYPSLHDSSGNVVLGALAQGLPVICLDLGGPAEMVDASCGRVVAASGRTEAACVQALADAIEQMSRSPELRQRLGEGARARARQFFWPRQVVRVYADIERRLEGRLAASTAAGRNRIPAAGI